MPIVPAGSGSVESRASLRERCSRPASDDLGLSRPGTLSRRVELRRTRNYDGREYLAILIREPLSAREITRIQRFLDAIDTDRSSRWRYRVGSNG